MRVRTCVVRTRVIYVKNYRVRVHVLQHGVWLKTNDRPALRQRGRRKTV